MICGHFHTEFGMHQSKDVQTVLDQTDVRCSPIYRLYCGELYIRGHNFEIFVSLSTSTHLHKSN